MTSGTSTLDSAAVLAAARRARRSADAAELEVFEQAVAWARLHEVSDVDDAATWGDSPVPLAGPGAPLVSSFCVSEFSACLGLSDFSGRSLLAHAVEIANRLTCLWEQVQAGRVRVWKARRIAERTLILTPEAAAYVDRHVAPYAGRISLAAVERLVDEAIARHMPEVAQEIALQAADARHVGIHHDQVSFAGTSRIEGELDLADALDLDAALQTGAQQLADLGSELHLDARRALALGQLARGEQTLPLTTADPQARTRPRVRQVVLYVHLSEDALRSGTRIARVENAGTHLITIETVRDWCGSAHVIVKPVLDLAEQIATTAYEIPDRLREQITLRNQTCVFPYCTFGREPERADPACRDTGAPAEVSVRAGSALTQLRRGAIADPAQAALLRCAPPVRFRRVSSLGLRPRPHGYTFTTERGETRDLTPRPVDPPGG